MASNSALRTFTLRRDDVYKIYAESFKGEDHLKQVQAEAKALVDGVIA